MEGLSSRDKSSAEKRANHMWLVSKGTVPLAFSHRSRSDPGQIELARHSERCPATDRSRLRTLSRLQKKGGDNYRVNVRFGPIAVIVLGPPEGAGKLLRLHVSRDSATSYNRVGGACVSNQGPYS